MCACVRVCVCVCVCVSMDISVLNSGFGGGVWNIFRGLSQNVQEPSSSPIPHFPLKYLSQAQISEKLVRNLSCQLGRSASQPMVTIAMAP